ncbi:MAG: hypothetical protein V2B13_06580 [Pseudomonadota bacterium]
MPEKDRRFYLQQEGKSINLIVQKILKNRGMVILLLVALTFLSILFLYSLKFNRNITGFMVIGDYFKAPQIWTSQTLIHKNSVGYDGQFYYFIAHDPFILGQSYDHIDFPAYRYQRIIYPLTAWVLSLGQPPWIPYMLVAVNLFAVLVGTYFIILLLEFYGRNPWVSLFYPALWGFLLCLLRSLPEPLAITFVVMAVFFYLKGKTLCQVISLSLAALTQETTLLVSIAFFLYFFWKRDLKRSLYMVFSIFSYLVWQLYIHFRFQTFSFIGGTKNFSPPFLGITEKFHSLSQGSLSYEIIAELLFLFLISVLIITALYDIFKYYSPLTLSFLGYALMTALLNHLIWVEPWSYARATLGLLVFNLLIFTKYGRKLNLFPMFLIPVIFLLSILSMRLL